MNWYFEVLIKYAVFSGRARRKEYWMFFLFNLIFSFILGFMGGFLGALLGLKGLSSLIGNIYMLVTIVPSIAVGVRRMHDIDKKGWWIICPIVGLVYLFRKGTEGANRFGPDPKVTTLGGV